MPVETIIDHPSVASGQWSAEDEGTLTESGFYWRERGGVRVLVCKPLEDAGFVNGFSTRLGGVSDFPRDSLNLAGFDEDSAEDIRANRRRFLSTFDGEFRLTTVWQAHGNDVRAVLTDADVPDTERRFDALVSQMPGVLAGVKTADCVPILIGDPLTKAFAAVHAGWRGTSNSIAAKAVDRLITAYGCDPQNMVAAIGPHASGRNYEVGRDVIDAFEAAFSTTGKYVTPTREGHALIDLGLANADQLISSGLNPENIHAAPFCTIERTNLFFSYRVEKKLYGKTGRLLSVIGHRQTPLHRVDQPSAFS